jgi:hypothetical protein
MKKDSFNFKCTADGGMEFTETTKAYFKNFLKSNPGRWMKIEPLRVESSKQRRFFEGAVVPLFAYYQENLDYHNADDLRKAREWLKIEFNGEILTVSGKAHKVGKTTRGEALNDFVERVIAGMEEQGAQVELLNPEDYKYWRDVLFGSGIHDSYIDYLLDSGKLK